MKQDITGQRAGRWIRFSLLHWRGSEDVTVSMSAHPLWSGLMLPLDDVSVLLKECSLIDLLTWLTPHACQPVNTGVKKQSKTSRHSQASQESVATQASGNNPLWAFTNTRLAPHLGKSSLILRSLKWRNWNNIKTLTITNSFSLLVPSPAPSLSSDLSELQLQASCDAQSQGGAQFSERGFSQSQLSRQQQPSDPALTGPAWGLPGGDNPQSPAGVRTHPTCLAAS